MQPFHSFSSSNCQRSHQYPALCPPRYIVKLPPARLVDTTKRSLTTRSGSLKPGKRMMIFCKQNLVAGPGPARGQDKRLLSEAESNTARNNRVRGPYARETGLVEQAEGQPRIHCLWEDKISPLRGTQARRGETRTEHKAQSKKEIKNLKAQRRRGNSPRLSRVRSPFAGHHSGWSWMFLCPEQTPVNRQQTRVSLPPGGVPLDHLE
ncbi:hypothetical protein RRG08_042567 [Elysia crispata]|uniref:Uncharacterized protein n=1 Tax=Elysia crispata TaxID=231223 RepID=A0AAE1CKA5_9GAST|nr:hypothetical protein RRG08_042567 [Elysia crispata]